MSKFVSFLIISCVFINFSFAKWHPVQFVSNSKPELRIVPQPQKMHFDGQEAILPQNIKILDTVNTPITSTAKKILRDSILAKYYYSTSKITQDVIDIVKFSYNKSLPSEGYKLNIKPNAIIIEAGDDRGIIHAVQSLSQLICVRNNRVIVPTGTINDYPNLAWRGIFTTGLSSVEDRKKLIQLCSKLKINTIIVRVDRTLKYERHPQISSIKAKSKKDYQRFVRTARKHGIEVIPQSSLYSHFGWAVWHFRDLMEVPHDTWNHFATPEIDNPKTAKLITDIMEEVVEAFDNPKYYHVGQDELSIAPRPPAGVGRSRTEKFADVLKLLKSNCDRLNSKMMLWADQFNIDKAGGAPDYTAKLLKTLPRDIIMCDWSYFGKKTKDFRFYKKLCDAGFQVLGCTWYELPTIEKYMNYISEQSRANALGTICTQWSGTYEYFKCADTQMALVWSAENAWSIKKPEYKNYQNFPSNTFKKSITDIKTYVNKYKSVDLSSKCNKKLDDLFGRGIEFSFSQMPNLVRYEDYNFKILNSAIVLGGKNSPESTKEEIDLRNEYADTISFLHITDLPPCRPLSFTTIDNRIGLEPTNIAEYKVYYKDGSSAIIPIIYNQQITDWNEPAGSARAPVAWDGHTKNGTMARVTAYRWKNPYPKKQIKKLALSAGRASMPMAIFAVSLEKYNSGVNNE